MLGDSLLLDPFDRLLDVDGALPVRHLSLACITTARWPCLQVEVEGCRARGASFGGNVHVGVRMVLADLMHLLVLPRVLQSLLRHGVVSEVRALESSGPKDGRVRQIVEFMLGVRRLQLKVALLTG